MSAGTDGVHLSRQDVIFGRALIAFKLVSKEALDQVVAEYRGMLAEKRDTTLSKLVIARGLITLDQYKKLVEEVRRLSVGAGQAAEKAAQALPDVTRTGSYAPATAQPGAPPPAPATASPTASVASAVESFKKRAPAIVKEGSLLDVGSATATNPALAADAAAKKPAAGAHHPNDAIIRKKLKAHGETFEYGDYQDCTFLGAGSVSVVYRAKAGDGRTVALKLFASSGKGADKTLRRFLQERRVFQGLDHPGLVKVHDVGIIEDIPYFAADFVDGKPLAEVLAAAERPAREVMLAVVAHVCEAVAYLHEKGIVLRDLKPENIIIRSSDGFPVIIELGLAKDVGANLNLTVADSSLVVTPSYTAPEVQQDPASATVASDVFSLGVLLYYATCGKLPFEAKNLYMLLDKMLKETPRPPSEVDPTSPKALDDVCARALAAEPPKRPQSANALAKELDAVLKGGGKKQARAGLFARLVSLFRRG